jgi:putative membrane protein insertion efficiency factor
MNHLQPESLAPAAPRDPLSGAARLPSVAIVALINLYQRIASPILPAVFGPACGCRFSPTCSHYAAQAVRTHGTITGGGLAIRRLLKCTPLHPGGFDPVPGARARIARIGAA